MTKSAVLLIARVGIGALFTFSYGLPKVMGGVAKWTKLGYAMESLWISFWPTFWGLLATGIEFLGGIFIVFGLFFRSTSLALAATMLVIVISHINPPPSLPEWKTGLRSLRHPLELFLLFLMFAKFGAGKYSLDNKIWPSSYKD